MSDQFTPLLTSTDWNEEWKELQKARRRADDADFWDKRSATFADKDAPSPYVRQFLDFAAIRPGETVFDMGCGTGALAIPLGEAGHKVVAADFSQGMLNQMEALLQARGVRTVFPKLMSWEDDWPAFGVRPGMTDVALASRSIATADLRDSLLRLTDVARRRVCVTLPAGASPRVDEDMLAAVGISRTLGNDFLYAFNILAGEGLKPEVRYIRSLREDTYESREAALQKLAAMVDDPSLAQATDTERARARENLEGWLDEHLVPTEAAGEPDRKGVPQGAWRLREPRITTWAFMAWDK